mgnify:CR=1|tara:strand:+ start:42 stop:623 length:582 start_codon:yes stop_codon:yes gene_type:complete
MGSITRTLANNLTTGLGTKTALEFITSATPSGNPAVMEFQNCFSSSYRNYKIIMSGMAIQTTNSDMVFRLQTGASVHSSSNYYWSIGTSNRGNSSVTEYADADSRGRFTSNTHNDNDTISFEFFVSQPEVSGHKTTLGWFGGDRYSTQAYAHAQQGHCWVNSGNQFDGIRFYSASGYNWRDEGKILIYGLTDS